MIEVNTSRILRDNPAVFLDSPLPNLLQVVGDEMIETNTSRILRDNPAV